MMSTQLENKRPKNKDQCRRLLVKNFAKAQWTPKWKNKGKEEVILVNFFAVIKDSV